VKSHSSDADEPAIIRAIQGILVRYEIRPVDVDVNHQIAEKVRLFLAAKKLEGASIYTLKGYGLELKIFGQYFTKDVDQISTSDIRWYLSQFPNHKASTIGRKLAVLKSFFAWLTDEEIVPRDPARKIKYPKGSKRLPKALTIEELELLREGCQTLRDRALVEFLYHTGCRLSEVYGLNRSDINWQEQSARVVGKGNKERVVFFGAKAAIHLRRYLDLRKDAHPAVFVTDVGLVRRLSRRAIQYAVQKIADRAPIDKGVHPHILRHTLATLLLNSGADLAAVQDQLGHANPATTQIYAALTPERRREQYRRHLVQ